MIERLVLMCCINIILLIVYSGDIGCNNRIKRVNNTQYYAHMDYYDDKTTTQSEEEAGMGDEQPKDSIIIIIVIIIISVPLALIIIITLVVVYVIRKVKKERTRRTRRLGPIERSLSHSEVSIQTIHSTTGMPVYSKK